VCLGGGETRKKPSVKGGQELDQTKDPLSKKVVPGALSTKDKKNWWRGQSRRLKGGGGAKRRPRVIWDKIKSLDKHQELKRGG